LNRKIIFLNVMLLALAGWLFWMLRVKWLELHQHERTVLALPPHVRKLMFPPSPPPFGKMSASEYNDVLVQKVVFFKDRNPNVIVDPPPPPPPAPPAPKMPDLPAYYGTMALFGDPVILLSLPKGPQKKYHAGETVGPFKLVSFDKEKVVFDWDGKIVERKPEELKELAATQPAQEVGETGAPPVKLQPLVAPPAADEKHDAKLGPDNGGGVRMCVAGDTSPPGTEVEGYKKVVTQNMFGATCMWQKVNP
jgi:hypothetical protein